jgi:hypothetical protein
MHSMFKRRVLNRIAVVWVFLSYCCSHLSAAEEMKNGPEFFEPVEPIKLKTLPFVVNEPSGVHRQTWPVRGGIPLPRGELLDVSNIRLLDETGKEIPVQGRKLSMWPAVKFKGTDYAESVQWLLLSFVSDLKANQDNRFTLEYGIDVKSSAKPAHPVEIKKTEDGLAISNGRIVLDLKKESRFIRSVKVDGKEVFSNGGPFMLLNEDVDVGVGDIPPIISLLKANSAPTIDGEMSEGGWAGAQSVDLHDFRLNGPPEHQTKGKILLDDQNLYVALECFDPDIEHLKAPKREQDSFDIQYDDHIVVYLDPAYQGKTRKAKFAENEDFTSFIAISISPSGAIRDQLIPGGIEEWDRAMAAKNPRKFKTGCELEIPGFKFATSVKKDRWIVEMKIPLEAARLNWSWNGKGKWNNSGFSYADKSWDKTFGLSLFRHRAARETGGASDQRWPYSLSYMNCPPLKMARMTRAVKSGQGKDPLIGGITTKPKDLAEVKIDEIVVEEEGPVETVVRVSGIFAQNKAKSSSFTTRFHVYADRAGIRCFHTPHLGFERYEARLGGYGFDFGVADLKNCKLDLVSGNSLPAPVGAKWVQYKHDSIRDFGTNKASMAGQMLGTCSGASAGIPWMIGLRDCWEKAPVGWTVRDNLVRLEMYSSEAFPLFFGVSGECQNDYGDFDLPSKSRPELVRVSNTHEFWLSFEKENSLEFGKAVRQLALPFAGAEWNCASRARGLIAPYSRDLFPLIEDYNDYALWWTVNETHWREWYGWADYGNSLNALAARKAVNDPLLFESTYLRRGGYGWANDRKKIGLGFLAAWFRSGRRAWFDAGEAVTRNATDICASYPVPEDHGYPFCRPRRHAQIAWAQPEGVAARQGGQPAWPFYYFLTGDRRALDCTLMHAKFHTESDRGGTDTSSVHATRYVEYLHILNTWLITGDQKYRKILDRFNDMALKPVLTTGKWAVAPLMFRWPQAIGGDPHLDTKWDNSMPGMGHEMAQWEGPLYFYQLTGEPDMQKVVFKMAGDPVIAAQKASGIAGWYLWSNGYQSPMFRYADWYRWTENPELLKLIAGTKSPAQLLVGPLSKSPVPPATPETFIHPREYCLRVSKLPKLPADYLYPSGLTFRPMMLYTLKLAAEKAKREGASVEQVEDSSVSEPVGDHPTPEKDE